MIVDYRFPRPWRVCDDRRTVVCRDGNRVFSMDSPEFCQIAYSLVDLANTGDRMADNLRMTYKSPDSSWNGYAVRPLWSTRRPWGSEWTVDVITEGNLTITALNGELEDYVDVQGYKEPIEQIPGEVEVVIRYSDKWFRRSHQLCWMDTWMDFTDAGSSDVYKDTLVSVECKGVIVAAGTYAQIDAHVLSGPVGNEYREFVADAEKLKEQVNAIQ